jgi:hypothetical protein
MLLRMHQRTPFTGGFVRYHTRSSCAGGSCTVWQSAPIEVYVS